MKEIFIQYLLSKTTLSPTETELIGSLCTIKKLRKNQYLLQDGDVCRFVAFVTSGCLRTFTVDQKGNEHIIYFATENWWTGDRESYLTRKPSTFNIDAVEETELIYFSQEHFEQARQSVPVFNTLINQILEHGFIAAQHRVRVAMTFTAEEKYQEFITHYPQLANRIPQQMIASYLGMTPETLSRIRSTAFKKHL